MNNQLLLGEGKAVFPLDLRTKLLYTLVISTIMMGGGLVGVNIFLRPILVSVPLLLLIFEKKYHSAFISFILYSLAFVGENFFMSIAGEPWQTLILIYSGLLGRFLPSLIMGYYTVSTTTVSEFIASMQRLHLSPKLVIPLSVMFRFFPTVMEERQAIQQSMKMRGISLFGRRHNPVTLLEYRTVPVMMSVVKIGDELTAAALTRGLEATRYRTNICQVGFRIQDYLLILFSIICFTIYVFN